jgi:hypothetical protein
VDNVLVEISSLIASETTGSVGPQFELQPPPGGTTGAIELVTSSLTAKEALSSARAVATADTKNTPAKARMQATYRAVKTGPFFVIKSK